MQVEIITPEKSLTHSNARIVRVPGAKACFAMMHSHAPIISTLEPGIIRIVGPNQTTCYELQGPGVVEQHNDRILILAECVREVFPVETLTR